jgi:hypothetical protein
MKPTYHLITAHHPEREVTEKEFIAAERAAGFYSKFGPDHVATGGFTGRGMHGRVIFVEADVPAPKLDDGDEDQRRSDNIFYTKQLLARAAVVMDVDPDSISWFDVVDWMEKYAGVK